MKVLVTGFEPFGGEKINPSWEAVKALPDELDGATLMKVRLPVSFKGVREILPRLIVKERPDIVLLTGQAGGRPNVTVERVAINVMDSEVPDNDGFKPEDEPVFEGAPDAYFATIPVKAVVVRHFRVHHVYRNPLDGHVRPSACLACQEDDIGPLPSD